MDKADPLPDGSKLGEAEETVCCVVIASGNAAAVLEAIDEALDAIAQGVDGAIDRMLDATVLLGPYLGQSTMGDKLLTDGVAVATPICEEHLWVEVVLGHQLGIDGAVVRFARCQKESDRKTLSVGPKVDFGREATARTAKSLILSPPFAPAAQWCCRSSAECRRHTRRQGPRA